MSCALSGVRADRKYSYRSLEAFANVIRQQLRFPLDQRVDTLRLFEDLHDISIQMRDGRVIPFRGGVISLEDSEGYTRYDKNKNTIEILAAEDTYKRLEAGHPRAGYFVAHELGHSLLHTDQLVRLAEMPTQQQAAFHRGRRDHRAFEDTEWQANAFASALLMPARGLQALEKLGVTITADKIADVFGVSGEAARYRLDLYRVRKIELLLS